MSEEELESSAKEFTEGDRAQADDRAQGWNLR